MNLREFADAAMRHWRTFAVVSTAVAVIGLGWLLLTPTRYVSSTQLLVTISGSTTAAAYQNDDVARERVNSYIPLLTSDVIGQLVVDTLHVPYTASELAEHVSATRVPPNTSIIDVAVSADSADGARSIADAYARQFISYTGALETPTGADDHKVRVTAISPASDPRSNAAVRVALGALVLLSAILLGAVAVWVRARVNPVATNYSPTTQSDDQPPSREEHA